MALRPEGWNRGKGGLQSGCRWAANVGRIRLHKKTCFLYKICQVFEKYQLGHQLLWADSTVVSYAWFVLKLVSREKPAAPWKNTGWRKTEKNKNKIRLKALCISSLFGRHNLQTSDLCSCTWTFIFHLSGLRCTDLFPILRNEYFPLSMGGKTPHLEGEGFGWS